MSDFLNCPDCGKEWMRLPVSPGSARFCFGCGRTYVYRRWRGWRRLSARAERKLRSETRAFIEQCRALFRLGGGAR